MARYRSKKIIENPIFIRSREDVDRINILGHANRYINKDLPQIYADVANASELVPYIISHEVPRYLFVGAVVFQGRFQYEIMSESDFFKEYELLND